MRGAINSKSPPELPRMSPSFFAHSRNQSVGRIDRQYIPKVANLMAASPKHKANRIRLRGGPLDTFAALNLRLGILRVRRIAILPLEVYVWRIARETSSSGRNRFGHSSRNHRLLTCSVRSSSLKTPT